MQRPPETSWKEVWLVLGCSGDLVVGLAMGLIGLLMAYYGGLWGILNGRTKSTDHPSRLPKAAPCASRVSGVLFTGLMKSNELNLQFPRATPWRPHKKEPHCFGVYIRAPDCWKLRNSPR